MKTITPKSFIYCGLLTMQMLVSWSAYSQIISVTNGNWNTATTWSPSGVPASGSNVTINNAVNLDKDLTSGSGILGAVTINASKSLITSSGKSVAIKTGGALTVYGTLDVYDLDFLNGSTIYIAPSGTVIVRHDFTNHNNSMAVVVDGTLTIYGAASNGPGGLITGNGSINNLGGDFTGGGVISGPVVLPVDLLYFSAKQENKQVLLNWVTASEKNNDYFTVEKSLDGTSFSEVGRVKGSGSSSLERDYHLLDELSNGTVYYRLKQTDFNGNYIYTGGIVAFSSASEATGFNVFPNPVHDSAAMKLGKPANIGSVEVALMDMGGKQIYIFKSDTTDNVISLPQVVLTQGTYILTIKTGDSQVVKKIVVE